MPAPQDLAILGLYNLAAFPRLKRVDNWFKICYRDHDEEELSIINNIDEVEIHDGGLINSCSSLVIMEIAGFGDI